MGEKGDKQITFEGAEKCEWLNQRDDGYFFSNSRNWGGGRICQGISICGKTADRVCLKK